jgi:hypothetical protein
MTDPNRLRDFASWYREFAVRSGVATISVPRLQMADDLDREADKLDPLKRGCLPLPAGHRWQSRPVVGAARVRGAVTVR